MNRNRDLRRWHDLRFEKGATPVLHLALKPVPGDAHRIGPARARALTGTPAMTTLRPVEAMDWRKVEAAG